MDPESPNIIDMSKHNRKPLIIPRTHTVNETNWSPDQDESSSELRRAYSCHHHIVSIRSYESTGEKWNIQNLSKETEDIKKKPNRTEGERTENEILYEQKLTRFGDRWTYKANTRQEKPEIHAKTHHN